MNTYLAAVRALYFITAIVLVGEFAFRFWVERPAQARLPQTAAASLHSRRQRLAILAAAAAAALVSALLWFLTELQVMSGSALYELSRNALQEALFATEFGRVSLLRFGLALALALALPRLRGNEDSHAATIGAAVMALGLLLSVALTGHANAAEGLSRAIHLSSDMLHLLAAAAWLGALPPLALLLFSAWRNASAPALELAAYATRRFSILGIAAVCTLVLTGSVSAWYTEGSVPALFGTAHGRLLSLKLLLFAAMLALAASNRFRYTPQLPQTGAGPHEASRYRALVRIGAHALAEIGLGLAILCIVGALGVTTPGAHSQTLWPFRYTLSLDEARESALSIGACIAALAAAAVFAARRRRPARAGAAALAIAALSALVSNLAVPANPSSYFRSPLRYSAKSIADGARIYAKQCSYCHGPQGRGDGPAAARLAEAPADLTEHVLYHRQGDIWWWIEHGIPNSPMPAFGERIDEHQVWDLVNLLRARAEAAQAAGIAGSVQATAINAPDFSFQIGRQPQESLSDQRGRYSVLLVLFDPAEAPSRLRALARYQKTLEPSGLRVIAIASRDDATPALAEDIDPAIVAHPEASVAAAYAIFAGADSASGASAALKHAEFLIDRQGYIRARWTQDSGSGWPQEASLRRQLAAMERVKPAPLANSEREHVH